MTAPRPVATLVLDGRTLTCCAVAEAVGGPVSVRVDDAALVRIEASHSAAVAAVERRPVYGRSTGVGANKGVSVDDWPDYAVGLLRSHATSAGELRTPDRVRAMLLVRLNQLAAGGSGISPAAVAALAAMINADALPRVREFSGIGTGDLSALATTALGLLGEAPLPRELPPVRFGVHDALPFLSSNAATLADVALAGHRLQTLARAAITVATLTAVAVDANLEAFSPAVADRLPGDGGTEVCASVTRLCEPAPPVAVRIQDAFALRCLPQVHGSVLDTLGQLEALGDFHLNQAAENPLILALGPDQEAGEEVVHHGLFHLPGVALACDAAAVAVAQSVPLLLGRLAMLNDPLMTGLAPFLGAGRAGASGVMLLEFVAGSSLAVLRSAAVPASLGTVSISRGAEDDASFASRAAVQLFEACDAYSIALACELVAAVRAVRMRGLKVPSDGWGSALAVCAGLPDDLSDRDLTEDVALAQTLLPALAEVAVGRVVSP
ncbi:aromatic amino acid lyase [Spongisporangium articulatum]|uniref:Aromatic amino acid lyase n=1 Tax=Spongisporangium articulatum TaxID=3362603 RepID=A0ABW8AJ84_9ACTN